MRFTESILKCPFSEEDLKLACNVYVENVWKSVEVCLEPDFEPSEAHRTAIRRMIDQSEVSTNHRLFIRRLSVAAAIALIVVSSLFAIHANALSEWRSWLKRVLTDRVQYFFYGELSQNIYGYEIGWLPEGMQMVDHSREEDVETLIFTDNEGFMTVIISYYPMNSWDEIQVTGNDVSAKNVTFGDFEGTIYFDQADDTAFAILFDEEHQMVVDISTHNITDDDIMSILLGLR